MKKGRKIEIVLIIVLLLVVIFFTAIFTNYTLDIIVNSGVDTKINSKFDVSFSLKQESVIVGKLEGIASNGAMAGDAILEKNMIKGLKAFFTEPGQSVSYSFYALNDWDYDVFLKVVSYLNIDDFDNYKRCIPDKGTTAEYVKSACDGINVSIKVNSDVYKGTKSGIVGHILPKDNNELVVVTISYDEDAIRVDGPFDVEFGNIGLTYTSQD